MRMNILAAALLAPAIAFAPVGAMAHSCKGYHHHHHKGAYGSGKTIKKDKMDQGTSQDLKNQDLNKKDLNKDTTRGSGTTY